MSPPVHQNEPAAFEWQIERLAASDVPVLIIGESGAGKEYVARMIHEKSRQAGGAFVPLNCGAINASLAESQLFGHEKGSFTGAIDERIGCIEHAGNGTLFLDEVTEMPMSVQVKLLRVLESGTYYRVGGSQLRRARGRIISSTQHDLEQLVEAGSFREDLLYRLAVVVVNVPPLRARGALAESLARQFLGEFNAHQGTDKRFSTRALSRLRSHHWPGNVRELRNAVERAFILADDVLELDFLSYDVANPRADEDALEITIGTPLEDAQRALIEATVERYGGDKRRAAESLQISLKTIYNWLRVNGSRKPEN